RHNASSPRPIGRRIRMSFSGTAALGSNDIGNLLPPRTASPAVECCILVAAEQTAGDLADRPPSSGPGRREARSAPWCAGQRGRSTVGPLCVVPDGGGPGLG